MTHVKIMTPKTLMLVTATAFMAFSTPSFAQDTDALKGKAVDMAKDKVKSKVKAMASEKVGDMGGAAAEKGVDVGVDMMKGKSAKDAAMDSGKSTVKDSIGMKSPSVTGNINIGGTAVGGAAGIASGVMNNTTTDEKIKAGKIMLKGGSKEDAAMAIAKDRAKDSMMGKAKSLMSAPVAAPAPLSAPAPVVTTTVVNCPAGTTAQDNGTCMITGDYQGGN